MLFDKYNNIVSSSLLPIECVKPFPTCNKRKHWDNIPKKIKETVIKRAEKYLDYEFIPLKASDFLKIASPDCEQRVFPHSNIKNTAISALTIAECAENNDRFTNTLIDCIWSLLDECSWHYATSQYMHKSYPCIMPDVTDPILDMPNVSRGCELAISYYMMKEKFDAIDINIGKRIKYEIQNKIMKPFMDRDDVWWMANLRKINPDMDFLHPINNWTPYCLYRILVCFLFLEDNITIRQDAIKKTMKIMDTYLDYYPDDGCCDEGSSYWFIAPGDVIKYLHLLYIATDGIFNVFTHEKIKKMGEYIYNVYIGENYFVNFADAYPINDCLDVTLITYGLFTKNDTLLKFALKFVSINKFMNKLSSNSFFYNDLSFIFNYEMIKNEFYIKDKTADFLIKDYWYEDVQVMISREFNQSTKGLFLAAKAGHNDESHNHNDIGNFIIYRDSTPIIVDGGVETYTKDTFNQNRYNLWTMQSKYHNLPVINNCMQEETRFYKSSNVKYIKKNNISSLSMSLKGAYNLKSKIINYDRNIIFNRNKKTISVSDNIKIFNESDKLYFSFITPCDISINEKNELVFSYENKILLTLIYDYNSFNVSYEKITIKDNRLNGHWKDSLQRVELKLNRHFNDEQFTFLFI